AAAGIALGRELSQALLETFHLLPDPGQLGQQAGKLAEILEETHAGITPRSRRCRPALPRARAQLRSPRPCGRAAPPGPRWPVGAEALVPPRPPGVGNGMADLRDRPRRWGSHPPGRR